MQSFLYPENFIFFEEYLIVCFNQIRSDAACCKNS